MNLTEKDPLQSRIEITNWVVLAILTLISWFFMSKTFTLGLVLGGLVSIINFHWLYRDLKKVFQMLSDGAKKSIMIKYYLRFIVTGIVLFFIITRIDASVIGLLVGLSVVVINIMFNTVINVYLSRKNTLEDREQ